MEYPEIRIQDLETGEIIDRAMTKKEFEVWQSRENLLAEKAAEIESIELAKQTQKANLLERLGITAEEAALLLG